MTTLTLKMLLPLALLMFIYGSGDRALYDLNKPTSALELPDTLREISGIVALSDKRFACIQDENGIVFILNTESKAVEKYIRFGDNGDYEGIAKVEDSYFILRSDGVLFETRTTTE